jgi:predicted nucleic acid-binding protein
MSAFVDSSVWFAAAAKRNAQNGRAKSILRSIDQHLTTDLVLTERWQLLKAKFEKDVAESYWERLRDSGVRLEPVLRANLDAASEIEASFPDESFSFVDRTTFALMERLEITRAATFNPDFAAYRPRRGRKRPFQILSEGHSEAFRRVCPLVCDRGFRADGDTCTKIACRVGYRVNDDNECEKAQDNKPLATREDAKKRSGTLNANILKQRQPSRRRMVR